MTDAQRDAFLDLLTQKAVYGLDADEQQALDALDPDVAETELYTLEMTAAAISMIGLMADEPLPDNIAARILAEADVERAPVRLVEAEAEPWPSPRSEEGSSQSVRTPWFAWLGWAFAAALAVAFGLNLYLAGTSGNEIARNGTPTPAPAVSPSPPGPDQARAAMMTSSPDMIKANWAAGNVKDLKDVSGDVVWSDQKQVGYMRLHGLPVNDPAHSTYQLWIFDKTQDKATPIDGGTFNVSANGDVVIPIDPKLHAVDPSMFAITIEKPGGVVVSKREKIAALAQVETRTS